MIISSPWALEQADSESCLVDSIYLVILMYNTVIVSYKLVNITVSICML